MKTSAKIFRFDPSRDQKPYFDTFEYELQGGENILEVLIQYQKENPSFAFSYSCRDRHCGLCGVMMNKKAVLACKRNAEPDMVIEPLAGMRVIRDLLIDRDEITNRFKVQQLYIQRSNDPETYPETLPRSEYREVNLAIRCVECFCCQASCPVWKKNPHLFAGPTAFVLEAQYAFDKRDAASRLLALQQMGIDRCIQCGLCSKACIHKIEPAELIRKMQEMGKQT